MVVDTGVFIDHLIAKDKTNTIFQNIPANSELFVSAVTLFELYMGATTNQKLQDVKTLTDDLPVLPFNKITSEKAGEIYRKLRSQKKIIEFRDIFIAATAFIYDLPVLTRNKKHFSRIKDLKLVE